MNTQLKKGDRCQSPWGEVEIHEAGLHFQKVKAKQGSIIIVPTADLTRILTHAERMQKMIDTVFDCENRMEDNGTVQLKVGELAEFVRHYLAIRTALEKAVDDTTQRILDAEETIEKTKQLLNDKDHARHE